MLRKHLRLLKRKCVVLGLQYLELLFILSFSDLAIFPIKSELILRNFLLMQEESLLQHHGVTELLRVVLFCALRVVVLECIATLVRFLIAFVKI